MSAIFASTAQYLVNGSAHGLITPFDRGFAYGDGVFRTLKVVHGIPEAWPLHYQKLVADCSVIGIVAPAAELLMHDMQQLFLLNEIAVAKIVITRGESERGYAPPAVSLPLRVVIKSNLPDYPAENFTKGISLYLCETKLAHQPRLAGIKHLNRLESVLARSEWHDVSFVDGVMLDQENNVIECTAANIFAKYDHVLVTPDLSHCGVAGVMRERIMQLAPRLGYSMSMKKLTLAELKLADEVFICNSLYGAWPVLSCDNHTWQVSQLTEKINAALRT